MHDDADLRELRQRVAALERLLDRLEAEAPAGEPCAVGTTASRGSYPTAAGRFYGMDVAEVIGDEAEGATPSLTGSSGPVFAANLGSAIPPAGTVLPIDRVARRWVFRYDG
jgi:hypothetical protein